MAEENGNGKGKMDWRTGAFIFAAWTGTALIQYGVASTQIADLTRRTELIERQLAERSIARDEYERRHADLSLRESEDRADIRELEKRMNNR